MLTLEEILDNSEEIFQIKMGNAFLHPEMVDVEQIAEYSSTQPGKLIPKTKEQTPFSINEIIECLQKSPQINNVHLLNGKKDMKWEGHPFGPVVHSMFSPILKCNIRIPIKNQEFASSRIEYEGDTIIGNEEFDLYYNGSFYLLITKLTHPRKQHISYVDFRDFFISQLKENYSIETISPNPLRSDFYLCLLKDNEELRNKLSIVNDNIYPVIYIPSFKKDIKNLDQYITRFFSPRANHVLDVFYACCNNSISIEKRWIKISNTHIKILENIKKYINLNWYDYLAKNKIKKDIEKVVVEYYDDIIKYELIKNTIMEGKEYLKKIINDVNYLYADKENLLNNIECNELSHEIFDKCLSYTNNVIERQYTWNLAITTAIIATIITLIIEYGPLFIKYILTNYA